MKKIILAVLFTSIYCFGQSAPPQNIGVYVCSTYVKRDSTGYTNPVALAGKTYKTLKIAFKDSIIGNGVMVKQQAGFVTGRFFNSQKQDTLWSMVGDTAGSPYIHASGVTLSPDSIVVSSVNQGQLDGIVLRATTKDSLYIGKGYKVLTPDPSALTRFSIYGNDEFSTSKKMVYIILNVLEGHPVYGGR